MTYTPWQYVNIPVGEDYVIDLKMEEVLADASDRASYPVYINGLKLMLDNSKHPTGNTKVTIKEFSMNYGNLVVGINQLELISRIHVYPNPVKNGEAYLSLVAMLLILYVWNFIPCLVPLFVRLIWVTSQDR